jgi:hypothetical protein
MAEIGTTRNRQKMAIWQVSPEKADIGHARQSPALTAGSPVLIVNRGRPVARLEPVTIGGEADDKGRLSRLIRDGVVRPGRRRLSRTIFTDPPPRLKGKASAVRALIEERRTER